MRAQGSPHARVPRRVPVVTAFLTDGSRIALFERSDRVGSYARRWAGVSGYVERLPLDQALVEIAEETGLAPDAVELSGIGIPVEVDDAAAGRSWLVYPFLFNVVDPGAVRFDWEARRVEWFAPGDLAGLHSVPGLERALAAVWPPFGNSRLWESLASVAVDTVHGATALAVSGLRAVREYLAGGCETPEMRTRAALALAACRPSMGVFPNLAAKLLLSNVSAGDLEVRLTEAGSLSASFAAAALDGYARVLTNSCSGCVRDALLIRARSARPFEVVAMESRPGMEGVTLARELAAGGLSVSVITDAQAGLWIQDTDAVIVGCDAILEDNTLQNKAGTRLMALAARDAGVPCMACAQTFKIMPPGFPHSLEEQDPNRVGQADGVRFRNLVFDSTPLSFFEAVYTENDALTPEHLEAARQRLGAAGLPT